MGNVIFDHGRSVGVKKWRREELKQPGDYWYSNADWQVRLYSERNPADNAPEHRAGAAAAYRGPVQCEPCRLRRPRPRLRGRARVRRRDHAATSSSAIATSPGLAAVISSRSPDGKPVRFGNGIEFWENAHDNLVEGCRIWEIYDAALTNQGGRDNSQINITYRDNVIWNSEYSFEFWNRGPESTTRNVRFEHNTCFGAGLGWGHAQRPDPNGRHLMFFVNTAQTSEIVIRDNIFAVATDSCLRMDNDWSKSLLLDGNCWFQPRGMLIQMLREVVPRRSVCGVPEIIGPGCPLGSWAIPGS